MEIDPSSSASRLPLLALHRELGARFVPLWGALEAPADYGDAANEGAALLAGCGLVDRSWVGRLELAGEDRRRFLNGQLTCDVQSLEDGAVRYGFLLDGKGRVQADVMVLALEDRYLLELPPGAEDEVRARLEKYVLADRVEVLPAEGRLPLSLVGPGAEEWAASLAPDLPAADSCRRLDVLGQPVLAVRRPVWGLPALTFWVGRERAEELARRLLPPAGAGGPIPVGWTALETARVEAGTPRCGPDFGPDCFPQETGLEAAAVSYTKGCYLGQEVVARIHYRGQVQRGLVGLDHGDGDPPQAGTAVLSEGRQVGRTGSAVRSSRLGATVGLAILHRRAAEPGTAVEVEGGAKARVSALPFAGARSPR